MAMLSSHFNKNFDFLKQDKVLKSRERFRHREQVNVLIIHDSREQENLKPMAIPLLICREHSGQTESAGERSKYRF
jgi:hypothetical protein